MTRFTGTDVLHASADWNASCGPAALAAICNLTLDEVKPYFMPAFPGYTTPTRMFEALRRSGRKWAWDSVMVNNKRPSWPTYGLARIQWEGPWTMPGANQRWAYTHTHWVGVSLLHPMAVSIDPAVRFGRPVLRGTRVDVAVAADLHAAGESIERIAREYGVDAAVITDAIQWHLGRGDIMVWDVNQLNELDHTGWAPLRWWTDHTVPLLTRDIKRATGGWHITHSIEVQR